MADDDLITVTAESLGITHEQFVSMFGSLARLFEGQHDVVSSGTLSVMAAAREHLAKPEIILDAAEAQANRVLDEEKDSRFAAARTEAANAIMALVENIRFEMKRLQGEGPTNEAINSANLMVVFAASLGAMCTQLEMVGEPRIPTVFGLALEGAKAREARAAGSMQAYGSQDEQTRVHEMWRKMFREMQKTNASVESNCRNISKRCWEVGIINKASGEPFTTLAIRRVVAP